MRSGPRDTPFTPQICTRARSSPNSPTTLATPLGVLPAQMLAQSRPGAKGALLFHACIPTSEFGSPWPQGIPLQIHMMEADEVVLEGGDLDAARQLAGTVEGAELFLIPRRSAPLRRRQPARLRR